MYGIHVKFNERGKWSKAYTYLSEKRVPIKAIVIVRSYDFYSIGLVSGVTADFVQDPEIEYKRILKIVGQQ
jgi:hypothetical protein